MQWGICAMTFQTGLGSQLQKRRSGLLILFLRFIIYYWYIWMVFLKDRIFLTRLRSISAPKVQCLFHITPIDCCHSWELTLLAHCATQKINKKNFSASRFAKSWYFLVFVSCQYVHWTSKFADNDVFGGFVDENDVGFEHWIETS